MKKYKKAVSFLLMLMLFASTYTGFSVTGFAADVAITAEVEGAYTQSDQEQDITVRINVSGVSDPYTIFAIDGSTTVPDGFTIKSFSTSNDAKPIAEEDYNVNNGKLTYLPTGKDSIPGNTYYNMILTAPAKAAGDYSIDFNNVVIGSEGGYTELARVAKVTATFSIDEPKPGYIVSLSADPASVEAGKEFNVSLDVTSGDKANFNTLYAELSYDKDLVEYAGEKIDSGYANVGGYSVTKAVSDTNSAEKLILETYGDTNIAVSKNPDLTLPFKAKTNVSGDAEFSLQNAKVDQLNNANVNAALAASGDPITVKITEPTVHYTVTFDTKEHGTAPQAQTVESGQKATDPGELTAEGWKFGGWYKEAACTTAWNFDEDTVTGNVTLYAKWTEITPTVTTKTDYVDGYTLVIATLGKR